MYAILQHGGRQYRVGPGDRLLVDRLDAEVGVVIGLEPVLFLADGDGDGDGKAGSTQTNGARVAATVLSHRRGKKLRVFKYKPKKRYRRTMGYRSDLTELRVEAVVAKGEALPKPPAIVKKVKAEAPVKAAARPAPKPEATTAAAPKAETKAQTKAETPKPKAAAKPRSATKPSSKPTKPAAAKAEEESGDGT